MNSDHSQKLIAVIPSECFISDKTSHQPDLMELSAMPGLCLQSETTMDPLPSSTPQKSRSTDPKVASRPTIRKCRWCHFTSRNSSTMTRHRRLQHTRMFIFVMNIYFLEDCPTLWKCTLMYIQVTHFNKILQMCMHMYMCERSKAVLMRCYKKALHCSIMQYIYLYPYIVKTKDVQFRTHSATCSITTFTIPWACLTQFTIINVHKEN